MSLIFREKGHQYNSTDPNENIIWTSVTSLVSMFKEPFNPEQAVKSSKNRKSKWYNKDPEEVKKIWAKESKRATDLGTYYHNQREKDLMDCESMDKEGQTLPVIPPNVQDDVKYAPDQKLIPGIYPEHFVYLKSAKLCGQADYVAIVNNHVHITDYKTNKEIKLRSYKNWEGIYKMLRSPISDIEDCHLQHYTLQLSIYMYIILKHNPRLKPGNMIIQHVIFEKIRDDENGYPVTLYNDIGDPVIKEIIKYEVPYMKEHVIKMINHLKNNEH